MALPCDSDQDCRRDEMCRDYYNGMGKRCYDKPPVYTGKTRGSNTGCNPPCPKYQTCIDGRCMDYSMRDYDEGFKNFIPAPNCFGNCPNPQAIYYYPPPGGAPCPSTHPNSQMPNCAPPPPPPPQVPGITQTFTNNMMNGYNQFGCSFLYNRQGVLQNKLNQLQSAGTNPLWQQMLQNRITYMSNMIMNNCTGGPTPPPPPTPPIPPRTLPPSGPQAPQTYTQMMNAIGDDEFNPNPPITTTSGRITTTGGGQCYSDSDCGGGQRCVNGYCQTTTRSRTLPPPEWFDEVGRPGRMSGRPKPLDGPGSNLRFDGGTWMKSDY